MADGIAESVDLAPRAMPVRRVTVRMVGEEDGSGGRVVALPAAAMPRQVLSASGDLLGVGPGGWTGAALLYAAVIAGGLWLGWQVTPPAPWPASEATFRVIFETPPAPQAETIPEPQPAPPTEAMVIPEPEAVTPPEPEPPPEAVAPPEPAPPPVVVAEPEPAEIVPPKPPPPKPQPRHAVAKPAPAVAAAPQSAAPPTIDTPVASAAPQVAALPIIPPQPIAGRAGNPKPDYSAAARRRGLQGKVVLLVEVSAAGLPANVAVTASSGHAALDQAALAAVQLWRFSPATRGGTPMAGTAQVPIQFRLEE
jgi:periplasmic protein TonB